MRRGGHPVDADCGRVGLMYVPSLLNWWWTAPPAAR
ncbi:trp operon leader peptide [Streptomyces sp. J2-1]|nr:trp operon leader peptide [Streptomyces corallincola]